MYEYKILLTVRTEEKDITLEKCKQVILLKNELPIKDEYLLNSIINNCERTKVQEITRREV